jgi:hypothetical protein
LISKHNSLSLLAHVAIYGSLVKVSSRGYLGTSMSGNVKKGWTHSFDTQQEEAINMNPKT